MFKSFLELVAPVKCVFCGAKKTLFCPEHVQRSDPKLVEANQLSGYFAQELDPALLSALSAFKDRSITALAKVFGRSLEPLIQTQLWAASDIIVIPPSTPKAYRSRGFVPVLLMLRKSKNQLPIAQLRLSRRILDQRALDASERRVNLSGAFRAPSLQGKSVLLFDDVMTTSATLQEMNRTVVAAGGVVTGFCVLAKRFVDSGNSESI